MGIFWFGELKQTMSCAKSAHWPLPPFLLNCTWKLLHLLYSPEFAVLLPTILGENLMGNTTSSVCIKLLCVCMVCVPLCEFRHAVHMWRAVLWPWPSVSTFMWQQLLPAEPSCWRLCKISQLTIQTGIPSTQVPDLPEWVEAKLSNLVRTEIDKGEAYK